MVNIRQANTCESGVLTDIAARSEAYWGYDVSFMNNYKTIYRVTEEFIINNTTFVIEENDSIIGFYSIIKDEKETSLEYFYIEPEKIGKGYGKILWKHVTEYCKGHDIIDISLVTSPQAKDFYIKMGAKLIGEVDSLVVKNRKIPKLIYTI